MAMNLRFSKDGDSGSSAVKSSLLTRQFLQDNVSHSVGNAHYVTSVCNGSRH